MSNSLLFLNFYFKSEVLAGLSSVNVSMKASLGNKFARVTNLKKMMDISSLFLFHFIPFCKVTKSLQLELFFN